MTHAVIHTKAEGNMYAGTSYFVRYIHNRIINHKNMLITIVGPTGCLAGDTIINTSRNELGRPFTIKYLYNIYNGIHNPLGKGWDLTKPTFVRSFNGEIIRLNKLKNVLYSGKQKLYKLTLENGLSIKATNNHKFLTKTNGWIELSKLGNQEIMCDTLNAEPLNRKRIRLRDIGLCVGKNHPYNKNPNGQISVHVLIYEARMNNLKFTEYLDILLNEPEKCKQLKYIDPSIYVIHHKDGCHYNNSIDNLELLPNGEHCFEHNEYTNFSQGVPKFSKVVKSEYIGEEDTYDIECEQPHTNFVANGIIVHNSGKSYAGLDLMYSIAGDRFDMKNVCFRARDFVARLNSGELKPGDVILWDESGVDLNAKQWMSLANRIVNLILQTFRHRNLVVIFTLPYLSFLDSDTRKLLNSVLQTQKIDFDEQTTIVKPFLIQVNQETGKMYRKYLRVKNEEGIIVPVKRIKTNLPPKEVLDEYEGMKTNFTNNLNKEIELMFERMEKKEKDKWSKKEELTEKQKEAVELYKKLGTIEKVADVLGIRFTAVAERLNGAKKKLKIDKIDKENEVFPVEAAILTQTQIN